MEEDVRRVNRIMASAMDAETRFRLDANQAWTLEEVSREAQAQQLMGDLGLVGLRRPRHIGLVGCGLRESPWSGTSQSYTCVGPAAFRPTLTHLTNIDLPSGRRTASSEG